MRTMRDRMQRWGVAALVLTCLTAADSARAQGRAADGSRGPTTSLVVVSGVSGEKRFADAFHGWSQTLATAAARWGIPDSLVTILAENTTRDPRRIRGRSTRDNVMTTLSTIAARARAGDRIIVMLFGHGNAQDDTPRLNVPGPDLTAADFAMALEPAREATVLFVNTASASGGFVKALSGKNRIVVTATRSPREQNETYFPHHFVAALTSESADADKDGRVNVLEAFTYARREVERLFEQGNRIATEHALLDDDGDGTGHTEASEKGPDGPRARTFFLAPIGGAAVASDPRAAALDAERRVIEARIDSLRGRRSAMTEEAYQRALEPLMLQLAEKTRALRALGERKP